jgi:hypothetical protein
MENKGNVDLKEIIKDAFKYLGKKEIHVNELSDYIKSAIPEYKDVEIDIIRKKINSRLASDVKLVSKEPTFSKVKNGKKGYKKGIYMLRTPKTTDNPIKPDKVKQAKKEEVQKSLFVDDSKKNEIGLHNNKITVFEGISTSQIGKGGEFAVMSELLFRGFNASSMTVDDGVDIAATKEKDGRFFFIQVKTTSCDDDTLSVNIDKNSYSRYNVSNMFYVIVVRFIKDNLPQNQYLIFNSYDIEKLVSREMAGISNKYISMKFKMWNGGIFIVRQGKSDDVTFHLNNWSWIK